MATADAPTFADNIKSLGDSIVKLTVLDAKALSDYLEEVRDQGAAAAVMAGRPPPPPPPSRWREDRVRRHSRGPAPTRSTSSRSSEPPPAWASRRPRTWSRRAPRPSRPAVQGGRREAQEGARRGRRQGQDQVRSGFPIATATATSSHLGRLKRLGGAGNCRSRRKIDSAPVPALGPGSGVSWRRTAAGGPGPPGSSRNRAARRCRTISP